MRVRMHTKLKARKVPAARDINISICTVLCRWVGGSQPEVKQLTCQPLIILQVFHDRHSPLGADVKQPAFIIKDACWRSVVRATRLSGCISLRQPEMPHMHSCQLLLCIIAKSVAHGIVDNGTICEILCCCVAYHFGLSAKSMYSSLYGTCFSANVSRARWQKGPAPCTWAIKQEHAFYTKGDSARKETASCHSCHTASTSGASSPRHERHSLLICCLVQTDEYAAASRRTEHSQSPLSCVAGLPEGSIYLRMQEVCQWRKYRKASKCPGKSQHNRPQLCKSLDVPFTYISIRGPAAIATLRRRAARLVVLGA